jgi:hypothetical protein
MGAPNADDTPVIKREPSPSSGLLAFSAALVPAQSASSHVPWLAICLPAQTARSCTKPFLRPTSPSYGTCRATASWGSAARQESGALIPPSSCLLLVSNKVTI